MEEKEKEKEEEERGKRKEEILISSVIESIVELT